MPSYTFKMSGCSRSKSWIKISHILLVSVIETQPCGLSLEGIGWQFISFSPRAPSYHIPSQFYSVLHNAGKEAYVQQSSYCRWKE